MKKTMLAGASALALLAGCTGQRPTVDSAPPPTPAIPAEEVPEQPPGPTCADWNAQLTIQHDAATARYFADADGLNEADAAKLLTGLDNYCHRLPDDDLHIAAGSVVLCLWPDRTQQLRGPDCAAVRGVLGG